MPPRNTIQVVVTDELAAAIDKARGPLSRSAWARSAIEQQLTTSGIKAGTTTPAEPRKSAPRRAASRPADRTTEVEPRFGSKIPNSKR